MTDVFDRMRDARRAADDEFEDAQYARHRGDTVTAPAPSPAQQAVIDRFGIFEAERVVEEAINRSLDSDDPNDWTPRRLAVAAVAAYQATQDGGAEGARHVRTALVDVAEDLEWAATKQDRPDVALGYRAAAGRVWERLEDAPANGGAEEAVLERVRRLVVDHGIRDDENGELFADLDKLREAAALGSLRVGEHYGIHLYAGENPVGTTLRAADATLIAAAVTALPELLAEVRRGQALREAVEGLADQLVREAQRAASSSDPELAHPYLNAVASLRNLLAAVDAS